MYDSFKKIWASTKKFFYTVFPFAEMRIVLKKINLSIDRLKVLDKLDLNNPNIFMKKYNELSIEEAKIISNTTFEYKKLLEDKAKVNVFGVTISITLIIGLCKLLFDINNSFSRIELKIFINTLVIYALLFMIYAGYLSLKVLCDLNSFYDLSPAETTIKNSKIKLEKIALNTEINTKLNIQRNNCINWSYQSIRNSLLSLFLVFIVIIFNSNSTDNFKKTMENQKFIMQQLKLIKAIQVLQNNEIKNLGNQYKVNEDINDIKKFNSTQSEIIKDIEKKINDIEIK